jgi:hypothetical protein
VRARRLSGPIYFVRRSSIVPRGAFPSGILNHMIRYLICASVIAALPPGLRAQATPPAGASTPRSLGVARPREGPVIDGRLSEPSWQSDAVATDFRQVEPVDGATPTMRTDVRVLMTGDALFVGARMFDPEPARVVARLGRRDASTNSDQFTVVIDSYHDHRTGFRFAVNAAGVRRDDMTANDDAQGDDSWDPVWDAATTIDNEGWTVEIRIPLSQLRFSSSGTTDWGINFERFVQRTGELTRWQWVPNSETGYASLFGHLTGIANVSASRQVELVPYAVAQGDRDSAIEPSDPFRGGTNGSTLIGADFKIGLTSSLTVTGTVNPDFGQVEADPAEVNLTVFETFFQERRPFFVEGANLFSFGAGSSGGIFGAPQLFYTRRIGRPPSGALPATAEYSDAPEVTRILGAAKVSGQVGGWSIGLLDAITAREEAQFLTADDVRGSATIEPRTNVGVVSLRRDFRDGATGLGFMATDVTRAIDTTALDFLRSNARSAGLDFFHRFSGNQYSISGTMSASRIAGSALSIRNAQRSSARYYQRPDQDYVELDESRESLSGYAMSLSGGKTAGRWLVGADLFAVSPGFEINDAGFQQTADRIFGGMRLTHRWLRPGPVFRYAQAYLNRSQQYNFGRVRISDGYFSGFYGQLRNFWTVSLNGTINRAALNDKVTRGGPLALVPSQWSLSGNVSSDSRRSTVVSTFASMVRNRSGGYSNTLSTDIALRPSSALSLSLAPSMNTVHSMAGYVTAIADPTAVDTYGRRYLVANLTQRSFDMTVRADVSLSPSVSVQMYAQPFVSSVEYANMKSFTRPERFEFLVYGRDGSSTIAYDSTTRLYELDADGAGPAPTATVANPDFNLRSLRANVVLRWEYRAGSTLYLAWAHGRSAFTPSPEFDVSQGISDLLHDDQRNRLLLKVSYWFNP